MPEMNQHTIMRNTQWAKMWSDLTAQGWKTVQLWETGAPNFHPEYEQVQPRMLLAPSVNAESGLVLISAGGGFRYKTYTEAHAVAEFYRQNGINAAILDYRCVPYSRYDAYCDIKRAIRILRLRAAEFGFDGEHIAVCGFSAGGILSNMAAALYDAGDPAAEDPIERVSCRPDAAVICYGAMSAAQGRSGLGYNREEQNEIARLSPDQNIPYDAPPYFIFQTAKDDPRHGLQLASALADKGIPVELHIFKDGSHGQSLYDGQNGTENVPHTAQWAPLAVEWLKEYGF